jgi:hypothetical protein
MSGPVYIIPSTYKNANSKEPEVKLSLKIQLTLTKDPRIISY